MDYSFYITRHTKDIVDTGIEGFWSTAIRDLGRSFSFLALTCLIWGLNQSVQKHFIPLLVSESSHLICKPIFARYGVSIEKFFFPFFLCFECYILSCTVYYKESTMCVTENMFIKWVTAYLLCLKLLIHVLCWLILCQFNTS